MSDKMEGSQARSSLPAGSKGRKLWDPAEESLLVRLRQENLRVSWVDMQSIFNENLHSSRHRTSDALACKYKTIKSRDLPKPSPSNPPSQQEVASGQCSQQHQLDGTLGENVRSICRLFLLTTESSSLSIITSSRWIWKSIQ